MIHTKNPLILIHRWNVDDNRAFPFHLRCNDRRGGGGKKKSKFTNHITKTKQIYTKALYLTHAESNTKSDWLTLTMLMSWGSVGV